MHLFIPKSTLVFLLSNKWIFVDHSPFIQVSTIMCNLNHIYHQRLISQTKLLASHVNQSCHEHALSLFNSMYSQLTPLVDPFVFPLALKSCSALHHSQLGKSIHAHTFKASLLANPFVACALVDMYGKCVTIKDARKLFDEITNRNVVVWNSMISLYSRSRTNTNVSTALKLFEIMDVEPNASTFNSIMGALSELDHDDNGGSSSSSKAFWFYRKMETYGVKPNLITVLALLPACVGLGALNLVKEIHGYSVRAIIHSDAQVSSGLIEAYGRCGCISNASLVFDRMLGRDVVAWSSMVSAYAFNGEAKKALEIFSQMELEKVKPDGIAYLGVLKACSHAGLADEAQMFFSRMRKNDYGINVGSDHYACLVDVLSRAGRLHEAYEVIKEMPMKATAKAWGALLGACRSYGEVELAEIAGRVLFEIEPENGGNYVLLASVYAGAGRLDEAERVRRYMKDRGVMTLPGSSWVMGKKKNSDTQQ